jgi:predicted nucleic acid-binding Zn ribbon protein
MSTETKYYCKNCGKELSENERPCSECGSNARHIEVNISEYFPSGSAVSNKIKSQIENQLKDGTLKLSAPALTLDQMKTLLKEQKRNDMILALIGIIVTIVVGVVFWLMK